MCRLGTRSYVTVSIHPLHFPAFVSTCFLLLTPETTVDGDGQHELAVSIGKELQVMMWPVQGDLEPRSLLWSRAGDSYDIFYNDGVAGFLAGNNWYLRGGMLTYFVVEITTRSTTATTGTTGLVVTTSTTPPVVTTAWSPTTTGQPLATSSSDEPPLLQILLGVGAFVLVCAIGIGLVSWFVLRRKRRARAALDQEAIKLKDPADLMMGELQPHVIDYDSLDKGKELSRGNFGVVFTALFAENDCVVKELIGNPEDPGAKQELEDMLTEGILLSKLRRHGAVVAFYGVCFDPPCLVLELVDGGSLLSLLQDQDYDLSESDLLSAGRDLAYGLAHLEATGILHCDIAARNCLVGGRRPLRVKICE
jgi:Protein tyrosine and serine/threonine kinase